MRDLPFTTLQDVDKIAKNRAIVLFGAGNIALKTSRILTDKNVIAIIDNASNLWGEIQLGVEIRKPDFLKTKKGKDILIIICTTSFTEVSKQLSDFGFQENQDFIVSPILNDLRIISELESIEKKLLFTSGSPPHKSDAYGGGIYEMVVKGDEWEYKKVISGNCYGVIKLGKNFVSVDTEKGIFEFDKNYNILRAKDLPKGTRAHGISFSEKMNSFYVVSSYLDSILILDNEFNITDRIQISNKIEHTGSPYHHCNDCCVIDSSLYVTMFSYTGNWKNDVFDGVALEIDLVTKNIIAPVIKDLWMPHNISFLGGSLTVLESLRGNLRKNNAQIIGQFPAFTRGLAYDGIYYYIGQSRNRNFTKNIGLSKNISIDAGIIIFDEHTKVSRLLQLPPKISEIHAIQVVN